MVRIGGERYKYRRCGPPGQDPVLAPAWLLDALVPEPAPSPVPGEWIGNCGRPYATPCAREHACIRCPMLHVDPDMLTRLDELETDLLGRRARAEREGWPGELEGIDLTLRFLR